MKDITIEVVFATDKLQHIATISVPEDCSVETALIISGIQDQFPDYLILNNPELSYGVFGKKIQNVHEYRFKHMDRLEIYRKLQSSPNQKRLSRQFSDKL